MKMEKKLHKVLNIDIKNGFTLLPLACKEGSNLKNYIKEVDKLSDAYRHLNAVKVPAEGKVSLPPIRRRRMEDTVVINRYHKSLNLPKISCKQSSEYYDPRVVFTEDHILGPIKPRPIVRQPIKRIDYCTSITDKPFRDYTWNYEGKMLCYKHWRPHYWCHAPNPGVRRVRRQSLAQEKSRDKRMFLTLIRQPSETGRRLAWLIGHVIISTLHQFINEQSESLFFSNDCYLEGGMYPLLVSPFDDHMNRRQRIVNTVVDKWQHMSRIVTSFYAFHDWIKAYTNKDLTCIEWEVDPTLISRILKRKTLFTPDCKLLHHAARWRLASRRSGTGSKDYRYHHYIIANAKSLPISKRRLVMPRASRVAKVSCLASIKEHIGEVTDDE